MSATGAGETEMGVRLGAQIPRRGGRVSRALGALLFRALGWRIEGDVPDLPKMVLIGAPHTSNWDGLIAFLAVIGLGLEAGIMGKDSLFRTPLAGLMRWIGVFPVDRTNPRGVVGACVDLFAANERFLLGLAPEGTRKAAREWRSGFWNIASAAHVPILPVAFDYARKRIVVGAPLTPGVSFDADMTELLNFYRAAAGPCRARYASQPICAALGLAYHAENARPAN